MVNLDADYFRALETPRMATLAPNLVAAAFPLMKMMPARYILDRALADGGLKTGGAIVETTSGTFGMALALLAAARSYKLTLITAESLIDKRYLARLELLGARVIITADKAGDGDQLERLDKLHQVLQRDPTSFWPRQYDNPANGLAYAALAEQLVRAVGRIDCLVGCVGSGGSLCGTGTMLRTVFPAMTIIAVDTPRSVLFGQTIGRRRLRGLGNSIIPGNLQHTLIDEVHWVGAYPAFHETHRLLAEHGLFQGPTSGAAALVAGWVARHNKDARVAVILPDEGHRYADTVFDRGRLGALPDWANATVSAPRLLTMVEDGTDFEWTRFVWDRRGLAEAAGRRPDRAGR